ncbi:MAG: C40 family peptidase [Campylobacteraceae bacterium]|jgi:cell wall-associated NlpC family hydrolase|nr:C40 family peptidase [Campylobacteraceae bacterium]
MKRLLTILCVTILFTACADKSASKELGFTINKSDNQALYTAISNWLGTPYKIGGTTKKGIDCSGFAGVIYKNVYKKTLNRSSAEIFKKDITRIERSNLSEGDLVFFKTDKGNTPNHIGIYLKDDKFVHASKSKGVIVSSLDEPYYKKAWISGGRVK